MRCSERLARAGRAARRAGLAFALVLLAGGAQAHKSSDSYLQIEAKPGALALRWDIALRDLDIALDLDADGDGKLTWGEIKAAWPRIEAYATARLAIEGCELRPGERALERRNDGAYAVLHLSSSCTLPAPPVIRYALFAEVDPTHRGIAKVERPGEPVALSVLDPSRSATAGTAAATAASGASADASGKAGEAPWRWQFLQEGIRHILGGYDHVLFLLCLLLPAVMRRGEGGRWQPVERLSQAILPVVGIVTAFTVAHSITLALAALKLVSLPSWFIEPAIAVTIVLAAIDNVWPVFPVRRVVVTFFFGLIHGFGFASVLAELNLPTADFAWALLQFNLGLEAGQLMIVVAATAVLFGLRHWQRYRPVVICGGSFLAMAIAGLWFVERVANFKILPF
ncbi:MAG: HupE/UreJ family protein [Burkholderiales bacterium]|nr:HupE/UreJ family protein [Burkholderiales bacterium]